MWIFLNIIQIILIFFITAILGGSVVIAKLLFRVQTYPYLVKNGWAPAILKVSGVKVKVTGYENIIGNEPCVFVANHQSHFDIPALILAIEPTLFFIAKKELKYVPFLGWAMWAAGLIFIDRSNKEKAIESLGSAAQLIKNGKSILSFPEGTRSRNGEIGVFKRGTFILAKQAGVKIVPISISGADKIHKSDGIKINSGVICVAIGKPLETREYMSINPEKIAEKIRNEIIELSKLNSIKN
jgi:1-acyl-sn-glycerol-3-phosphate acyltransferase